jgi:hypothetical protein
MIIIGKSSYIDRNLFVFAEGKMSKSGNMHDFWQGYQSDLIASSGEKVFDIKPSAREMMGCPLYPCSLFDMAINFAVPAKLSNC